ncbi:capsule biosynthesis protein [Pseudomonas sp. I2]|uniref:capsular polysaccharide export protein, LipB/KpsS family n=1 Tax=unclassified Pseudomonas TaxID=196821 RepID=UPI0034D57C05
MQSIQRHLIVKAIFLLSKFGAHRASLACTDRLLRLNVSLGQLRQAVLTAITQNDYDAALRFSTYAIERYPSNSFGYLEKAKILAARGATEDAIETLEQAPSCGPVLDAMLQYRIAPPISKPKKSNTIKPRPRVPTDDLESSLLMAGNDASWLNIIAEQAHQAIKNNPENITNYNILARTYSQLNQHEKLIEAINSFPESVSSKLNYRLMLASAYNSNRNQLAAFGVLIAAQIEHPSERKLLMRISDMLRDDTQVARAYSYLCAAQAVYPAYGSVRRLSFEIDHALFDNARDTLLGILEFPREVLMKFMPMINRATPFFPDLRDETLAARNQARELIAAEKGRKGMNPTEQVKVAIKCRWLFEAQQIINRNKSGNEPVSSENQAWLNTVLYNLGHARPLVEAASANETSPHLYGLKNGSIVDIEIENIDLSKVVEVFIPTVFFAAPTEEKPSYATVREFLSNVYSYLMGRSDLILVPRHQWNWRNCDPRIPGAKVVSYHTNAPLNSNHLHIQEVPLAGRCSMDHQGFAGYSSLATIHAPIELFSLDCSEQALADNERELRETYVHNNVSKYSQTLERVTFEDDYVFVAMQIPTDTVAALASITGVELVRTVAEHYFGSSTKVRVKRHPYCNSMEVQRTLESLSSSNAIELSDASVHDLIGGAKAVFTVNSGVGLEALLHGRPVVITGDCDYSYAVSAYPRTIGELKTCLSGDLNFDRQRTRKLLHYYVNKYSIPASDTAGIHDWLADWLN